MYIYFILHSDGQFNAYSSLTLLIECESDSVDRSYSTIQHGIAKNNEYHSNGYSIYRSIVHRRKHGTV